MIEVRQKGDFEGLVSFLKKSRKTSNRKALIESYAKRMVTALQEATPKDTGKTAASWEYKLVEKPHEISIQLKNTNIQNGVPIAVLIQYGHATSRGYWIEGRDYINPAVQPLFDEMARDLLEGVK